MATINEMDRNFNILNFVQCASYLLKRKQCTIVVEMGSRLYNLTVDVCRFIKRQNFNSIANYIYSIFKAHSNINHSCPIDVSPNYHLNYEFNMISSLFLTYRLY